MTNSNQTSYKNFYKEQTIEEQKKQKMLYMSIYTLFVVGFITQTLFILGVLK